MSKRRRRSDDDDDGGARSRRSHRRRPYLYLVLDDWSKGYSVYKVDVSDFDGDPGADLDSHPSRLPEPPVFRLESSDHYKPCFAAAGSRIFAMSYGKDDDAPVLVYDTATGGLAVGPRTPEELHNLPWLVPASRDRLCAVALSGSDPGREHFLVLAAAGKGGRRWAWTAVRLAPFDMRRTTCHAAHPDGRTVFFSARGSGTYSFDTEAREWKRRGGWMLPFRGQAHYDGELDAWVGLHDGGAAEPPSVCSCDVVPASDDDGRPPEWKVAEEKMVCEDRVRCKSVQLAHMGSGKFCLVERRLSKGEPIEGFDGRCLLYATTFRLRYDKDGGLRATARRTRAYKARKESNFNYYQVFGI